MKAPQGLDPTPPMLREEIGNERWAVARVDGRGSTPQEADRDALRQIGQQFTIQQGQALIREGDYVAQKRDETGWVTTWVSHYALVEPRPKDES